jgi:hypothetical protein
MNINNEGCSFCHRPMTGSGFNKLHVVLKEEVFVAMAPPEFEMLSYTIACEDCKAKVKEALLKTIEKLKQ